MSVYDLARPLIFRLDAETAHGLSLAALRAGVVRPRLPEADPRLAVRRLGLDFANPLGLAAGYDKNGEVPDAVLALGFGFTEVGTVTPLPQAGNPRPRIFRLVEDRAVINRLGFNNEGHAALRARLDTRKGRAGIVGVNVGANKDSVDRAADYVTGIATFADVASYFTVNVSSPNTPGLRDLQARAALADLLGRCLAERDRAADRHGRCVPVLLKIAPDVDGETLAEIAGEAGTAGLDGIIVSNTTLARDGLTSAQAGEAGGLSGRPLFRRSTRMLARLRGLVGSDMVLVGVGGIASADDAYDKIAAGADLVQVYTGMVYEGPDLPGRIVAGVSERLRREGVGSIADLVGRDRATWADLPEG